MEREKQNNSVAEQNVFLSDAPIISDKEDILGRGKFAHPLAGNILRHEDRNTIVIGLYGKWGYGKSSIINILIDDIRQTKEFSEEVKPLILEFNPWNFSGQDNLTSVFFNEIANSLSYVDKSKNTKRISDKLKLYGYFLTSANLISNALRYVIPLFLLLAGLLILGASYFPSIWILW